MGNNASVALHHDEPGSEGMSRDSSNLASHTFTVAAEEVPGKVSIPSNASHVAGSEEKRFEKISTEMAKEDTEHSWDSITADGLLNTGPPASDCLTDPMTHGNHEKSPEHAHIDPIDNSTELELGKQPIEASTSISHNAGHLMLSVGERPSISGSNYKPIEIIEQNLAHIVRKNGGKLHMALWREEYSAAFGEKAFMSHLAAANCTKLTKLLSQMKTVTRGTGSNDTDYLYCRPHVSAHEATLSPEAKALLAIEDKLLLLIQGQRGKLLKSKASWDYQTAYGQRAMEQSLKDCRCSSLKSAVTKMARIQQVKENKKAYYVLSNPSQAIAIPPVTKTKSAQQTTTPMAVAQTTLPTNGVESACAFTMIDSFDKLQLWENHFLKAYLDVCSREASKSRKYVALSCKGAPEALHILTMAFMVEDTFVFDVVKLDVKAVSESLRPLFETPTVCKLFHDLHDDVAALSNIGGLETFRGMMDTQLIAEYLLKDLHCDFHGMLDCLDITIATSIRLKQMFTAKAEIYARRPITVDLISPVIDTVKVIVASCHKIQDRFDKTTWNALVEASDMRAVSSTKGGASRRVGFDVTRGYAMSSYELLFSLSPQNMMKEEPLEVVQDIATLLRIFPQDIQDALSELASTHLSDIVLDKGRRPHAWVDGKRKMLLGPDRFVQQDEIEAIAERFRFGSDNRAGLERQLHRISAVRNREASVIGMTVRVGRHVSGNAGIIADLLFNSSKSSILFLGEPGSGKTTIVREVTRILAEQLNVCIVDTSNEIAGDGDIPHPCVGHARRLMVPKLDMQSAVMIEAVQNHTPSIMVIDEIGRRTEVEAAQTCKNRGVRLIASAHGDLRKLVKNQQIRGVIGGIESVTLGDVEAKIEGKKHGEAMSKVKTQRAGAPIFEIVIELERGSYDSWRVVMDSGKAVDSILDRQHYETQRRTRDPETGAIHLSFEKA